MNVNLWSIFSNEIYVKRLHVIWLNAGFPSFPLSPLLLSLSSLSSSIFFSFRVYENLGYFCLISSWIIRIIFNIFLPIARRLFYLRKSIWFDNLLCSISTRVSSNSKFRNFNFLQSSGVIFIDIRFLASVSIILITGELVKRAVLYRGRIELNKYIVYAISLNVKLLMAHLWIGLYTKSISSVRGFTSEIYHFFSIGKGLVRHIGIR